MKVNLTSALVGTVFVYLNTEFQGHGGKVGITFVLESSLPLFACFFGTAIPDQFVKFLYSYHYYDLIHYNCRSNYGHRKSMKVNLTSALVGTVEPLRISQLFLADGSNIDIPYLTIHLMLRLQSLLLYKFVLSLCFCCCSYYVNILTTHSCFT